MKICKLNDCNENHHAKGFCYKHYQKDYQMKNLEKFNKNSKKWMLNNPEKRKQVTKNWRVNNPDYHKTWKKKNPDKVLKGYKKELEKLSNSLNMTSIEYRRANQSWTNVIKKLDNYMCKNCNSKDNLNSHHIMPKSDFPELSLDLDNGITLCEKCHSVLHGFEIY